MILNDDLLPVNIELLVTMKGMDDSLLVGVTKDNIHHTLTIILRSGDLSIGYFDLLLEYFDAVISPLDEWKLAYIAKTTIDDGHHDADLLHHEITKVKSVIFQHTLIFNSGITIIITSTMIKWHKINRPSRQFPRSDERFLHGPKIDS